MSRDNVHKKKKTSYVEITAEIDHTTKHHLTMTKKQAKRI